MEHLQGPGLAPASRRPNALFLMVAGLLLLALGLGAGLVQNRVLWPSLFFSGSTLAYGGAIHPATPQGLRGLLVGAAWILALLALGFTLADFF